MKKKVLIDCGHGIDTPGKRSPDAMKNLTSSPLYLREYAWTRDVGAASCCVLMTRGIDAELVVQEETDIPLAVRTERVNRLCKILGAQNVILASIHVNAAGDGSQWLNARGWSIYTSPGKTKADELATCIYNVAEKEFYDPRREYYQTFYATKGQKPIRCDWSDGDADYEAGFWMLRKTLCPSVLIENFFQDNKADVAYLKSDAGRGSCIHVITQGIEDFLAKNI